VHGAADRAVRRGYTGWHGCPVWAVAVGGALRWLHSTSPQRAKEDHVHAPGIDNTEAGPPPVRRAVTGVLLGMLIGALAAALLPRERRRLPPDPAIMAPAMQSASHHGAGAPPPRR
jgi:hypothetical protein